MAEQTTWELMERHNIPAPGSRIQVLGGFLDTYVETGARLHVSWGPRCMDAYVQSDRGGCGVRLWNFAKCEWAYDYEGVEKPHLKWPRARSEGGNKP